jgi:hypothetical protein
VHQGRTIARRLTGAHKLFFSGIPRSFVAGFLQKDIVLPVQEKFVLENKAKGCIVLEDDFVIQCSGRISFMNYNPEVDALNEQHQARAKQFEVERAEQDDVSAQEMAQVLGKRTQVAAGILPPVEQNHTGSKDPTQVCNSFMNLL